MKFLGKIGIAGALVLAICFLPVPLSWGQSASDYIYDNFTGTNLNTNIWAEVLVEGDGPYYEVNERLEITIPSDSTPGDYGLGVQTGPAPFYDAMDPQPRDFDVKVDFNLLAWPAGNGIGVGIQLFDDYGECSVKRASYGPNEPGGAREVYTMYFSGTGYHKEIETTDISGKLRMKRTGNKVECFYSKNNTWQLIGSTIDATLGPKKELLLNALTIKQNAFGGQTVKIALDNFLAIIVPPSPVAVNILDYELTKVGAWGKYSYITPPGFEGFKLTLRKETSGPYAGKYRLGDYHTPDAGDATWRIFDWSADRSLINIYADSLGSPPGTIPAVNNTEILIPSPFEDNIYWYFKKVPQWDVLAGRFTDGLAWIVFDENFLKNSANTDLGLDFVPIGVTDVTWYAPKVGEIAREDIDAATGDIVYHYQLDSHGAPSSTGSQLLLLNK
jgi:hypothetical protein